MYSIHGISNTVVLFLSLEYTLKRSPTLPHSPSPHLTSPHLTSPYLPTSSPLSFPLSFPVCLFCQPEFIITNDVSDPAFYSTCFIREKDITFLPVATKIASAKPRWKFAGKCLNCKSFAHAAGLGPKVAAFKVNEYRLEKERGEG